MPMLGHYTAKHSYSGERRKIFPVNPCQCNKYTK
jgi:hypothetical protein